MRQVTRKGLITVAAATGVIAVSGGYAHADASAGGGSSNSPGVVSGNTVQVPVHVPVNVCGNTIDVVGLLNPATGNVCLNKDGGGKQHAKPSGQGQGQGSGGQHSGADADGHASHSPGVISGNHIQVPVEVPVNVCGNSITIGGLGNPAAGNECSNDGEGRPPVKEEKPPAKPHRPGVPVTQTVKPPSELQLAETGSSVPARGVAVIAAGAVLGGAVLYRRSRVAA